MSTAQSFSLGLLTLQENVIVFCHQIANISCRQFIVIVNPSFKYTTTTEAWNSYMIYVLGEVLGYFHQPTTEKFCSRQSIFFDRSLVEFCGRNVETLQTPIRSALHPL